MLFIEISEWKRSCVVPENAAANNELAQNLPISVFVAMRWFRVDDCNWMSITIFIQTVIVVVYANAIVSWHFVHFPQTVMMVMMMVVMSLPGRLSWRIHWLVASALHSAIRLNGVLVILLGWIVHAGCARVEHSIDLMHFERLMFQCIVWMQPKIVNPKNKTHKLEYEQDFRRVEEWENKDNAMKTHAHQLTA